ncbi:MAG TPA: Uma2 family endonuclease [Nocardioidaceae bacterium]|nr:Uma2 family endonuclease [Nocardioidaceae bacterium]
MGTVTTLPRGQAYTRDDLESMPDDGRRYELVDGTLIVTPAPSPRHQRMAFRLGVLLDARRPKGHEVLMAPLDVALAEDSVLQPDLLVARRSDFTEKDLPVAPLLAVEVLSPSTRRLDMTLKRSRYESAGCASYWVLDPDTPSLVAWELRQGVYVEVAQVTGDQEFTADAPFAITFSSAQLLA